MTAARTARDEAAQAMFDTDQATKGMEDAVALHQQTQVVLTRPGRAGSPQSVDRLVSDWQALSARVDAAMAEFLDADDAFDRDGEYEASEARRFTDSFASSASALQALCADAERFALAHQKPLADARNLALAAPRAVDEAEARLTATVKALSAAEAAGAGDPLAVDASRRAIARLRSAKEAAGRRDWVSAQREAEQVVRDAADVEARVSGLVEAAAKARSAATSLATRREALQTRMERLPETMSGLRRRYTFATWSHLDDVPRRVQGALGEMDTSLTSLRDLLARPVVDVHAANQVVDQTRRSAKVADEALSEVTVWLSRLDAAAADPGSVVDPVVRKSLDVRRYLTGLPQQAQARHAASFDSLARRTESLRAQVQATRPEWGTLLREADAIMESLNVLVNAARAARS